MMRIKNIRFKELQGIMDKLMADPGQNPGIEKGVPRIVDSAGWPNRDRVDLQDGDTSKKKNDEKFFSQVGCFKFHFFLLSPVLMPPGVLRIYSRRMISVKKKWIEESIRFTPRISLLSFLKKSAC